MTVTLLQLTDLHLFADEAEELKAVPTQKSLRELLQFLRSGGEDPDQIVITGDLAHDERLETYQVLREMLGDWLPRCRMIPGNHDHREFMQQVFPEVIRAEEGLLPFACDAGNWRLIGLDSHVPGEVPGRIEARQIDWLQRELAGCTDRPVMLFLHHPPIPVQSTWLDAIGLQDPQPLVQIVESASHVKVVCAGHVHHEFIGRVGQAAFFTTPSTAVQFCPEGDVPQYDAVPPGCRLFTLDGDDFETKVLRLPELSYPPRDA